MGRMLKTGGLTALAAILAAVSVPATAQDTDGDRHGRGGAGRDVQRTDGGQRGGWDRSQAQQQQPAAPQPSAPRTEAPRGNWDRGQSQPQAVAPPPPGPRIVPPAQRELPQQRDRAPGWQGGNRGVDNRGGDNRGGWQGQQPARQPDGQDRWRGEQGRGNQGRVEQGRGDQGRNDQWRRDNDRNDQWRNQQGRNDQWRNQQDRGHYSGNAQNWNRDWRGDRRYDWNRYRYGNRDAFRIGRYSSPYNNWSYRRLGIGFFLQPLFFSNSYWINDPFDYRLPPAYGPYRWVRYYDDALLVNIYSGEVVDTVYDIFW